MASRFGYGLGISVLVVGGLGFCLVNRPFASAGKLVSLRPSLSWQAAPSESDKSGVKAHAEFKFKNVGGRPVRVTNVRTTCGCTKAEAFPEVIAPGAEGTVTAEGDPLPAGVRSVTITVENDSLETPELAFQLRMVGARKPPFPIDASGDLAYSGDFSRQDPRKVVVRMIEPRRRGEPPKLVADAPYIKIDPMVVNEEPYGEEGYASDTMIRTYAFPVRLDPTPAGDRFSAYISIVNPTDGAVFQSLLVQGSRTVPIKVVPARLSIASNAAAEIRVVSTEPTPHLVVAPEVGADSPLVIAQLKSGFDRLHAFAISVRPGRRATAVGLHRLIAKRSPTDEDGVTISVTIKSEATHDLP